MAATIRSYPHLALSDSTPEMVDAEITREKTIFAATMAHLENIKKQLIAKIEETAHVR